MNKIFSIIFICLSLISITFSSNYADISILVDNDGSVDINGITNYEKFKDISNSDNYTYKNKEFWLLNITSQEIFEDFIFEVLLPENSQINYIKTTPKFRIENQENRIKVIGFGENKPIEIIIQYKIIKNNFQTENYLSNFISSSIILLILFLFIYYLIKLKYRIIKNNPNNSNNLNNSKNSQNLNNSINGNNLNPISESINYLIDDISIFPKRQQDIILILKEKKKITQKELELIMNIPKSSISRNVNTLISKRIIRKERIGNSNYLFLIH